MIRAASVTPPSSGARFVRLVVTASSSMAKMMQSRTNRVRQPRGMRVAQATKLSRNRYMTSPPRTHQIRIRPTPILMMARWSGSASFERMKTATAVVESDAPGGDQDEEGSHQRVLA